MSPPQLLIPAQLDHLCEAFRFMNIWIAAKTAHDARARRNKMEEGQEKTNNKAHQLFSLSYQEVLPILQFLGATIEWKTQNTWGAGGSQWGGPWDLVIIERPEISNAAAFGIQIKLQVWTGGTIHNAKILPDESPDSDFFIGDDGRRRRNTKEFSVGRTFGQICWSGEENAKRSTKPHSGEIHFRYELDGHPLMQPCFRGTVTYPGEGEIGYHGRPRTIDPKTGKEFPNDVPVDQNYDARGTDNPRYRTLKENMKEFP